MQRIPKNRIVFLAIFLLIIAVSLPLYAKAYLLGLLTVAYYFGVFSMSWDLLFGYAGEVNFGPTFLIGLGAYTAGILNNQFGLDIYLCILIGSLTAVGGGVVLALPALRLKGPYFGLMTLVAVLLLQNVIVVMADLTGGEIGLTVPDVIALNDTSNYYIALGVMTVSGLILYALANSRFGLILEAIGQNPVEAASLGFNVTKFKLTAFVISAFFSGISGAFLVFYFGSASVGTLINISVGVQVIISAVLGGRRTIVGAVLGSVFMIAATEALRPLGTLSTFVVSLIALTVIMIVPGGFLTLLLGKKEASN
jgi:branched-chain amino acid transport system permease protein